MRKLLDVRRLAGLYRVLATIIEVAEAERSHPVINPAELDIRLINHAACVDAANRYGVQVSPKRYEQNDSDSLLQQLRRLAIWFGFVLFNQPKTGGFAA